MSNLNKDTLMQVYPSVLSKDKLFNALGEATAEVLGKAFLDTKHAGIYNRIAELNERMLDILAKDFNIQWYNYNYPLATKRRVIAAAFSVYFNNGTKGALQTAIQAIFPLTYIEEWFNYSGNPYHFNIVIGTYEEDDDVSYDAIKKAIELYKNERSYLDAIIYRAELTESNIYIGVKTAPASSIEDCVMY